jgi:hypothetical protein
MDIDSKSRDILNFRPNISFVEPDQQEVPIDLPPDPVTLKEVSDRRKRISDFAKAINQLATAVQLKIDNKCADQIIVLDSRVDNPIIQALKRTYPYGNISDRITYDQYKQCRDNLRNYADQVALKPVITDDDVTKAQNDINKGNYNIGGIGTDAASNGGLRPELDERNQLVEPVDMDDLQLKLIKMLVNFIWKLAFLPLLKPLPIVGSFMPDVLIPEDEIMIGTINDLNKKMNEELDETKANVPALSDTRLSSGTSFSNPNTLGSPGALNPLQFQDCQMIVKAYEKGCHASMTEASVFAPFTAQMDFIRIQSKTISGQMDRNNKVSSGQDSSDFESSLSSLMKSEDIELPENDEEVSDILSDVGEGILDTLKDCIPCISRINFEEELDIGNPLDAIYTMLEAWLNKALSQIKNLIDMFDNLDKYVDICALIKFFTDFVCIPDLAKILAVLAALMMDLSFELNIAIDLALSLVAPLFIPFFTNLFDMLMKYVLLILKPIECIIDSIQDMMGKLDYNVLFQNIPGKIDIIKPTATVETKIQIPVLGNLIPEPVTVIEGESPFSGVSIDLAPAQRAKRAEEQAAVDKAYENIQSLRQAAQNTNGADPEEYEKYKKLETEAREQYKDAIKERDMSEIGEKNLQLEKFQTQMKSVVFELVSLLREAVIKFDAFINSLFEEFKKLLNEYVGGTGIYFNFGVKKLAIIQMIAFIVAIIDFLNSDIDCDEDKQVEIIATSISKEAGFKVFTDDDGNVYLEEDIDGLDEIAQVIGNGNVLNYTGDRTLDTELSNTLEKLTIPNKIKIKCSTVASTANADKVNKWLQELNSE